VGTDVERARAALTKAAVFPAETAAKAIASVVRINDTLN